MTSQALDAGHAGSLGDSTADRATIVQTDRGPTVRYYTWQLPVRITHWLIFLSIGVLSVTGFYIGHPFIEVHGEARHAFVMGWMRAIHFYGAIVFTLSVASRILWMFVGNRLARWSQFVPTTRARWRGVWHMLRFYLFVDREAPPFRGHNPLAGLAYSAVYGLYLLMIATGFALYSIYAHLDSHMAWFGWLLPLVGGAQTARLIHHVIMWLLIGFFIHHVYSALLMSFVEKNDTMESIFTGYRTIPARYLEDEDS